MTTKQNIDISLVVPMYNEEKVIESFFGEIRESLDDKDVYYEIVCVDDGSSDNTLEILKSHSEADSTIKVITLSRNFGKEIAMTAGLDHAIGNTVVPIDCDLQDPPELIYQMYEMWLKGFDVVLAKRIDRQSDSFVKRKTSQAFYKFIKKMADIDIPENVGDFRLLSRKAADTLNLYREKSRFMKGLFASLGFKSAVVEYSRPERAAGETKWNYFSLYKLALEGIISFTSLPLKVWSYVGALTAIMSFIYGAYLIIKTLLFGVDTPGYASLMVTLLFVSGLILISLGVIGEYLARIFIEVKNRPIYIIDEKYGFEDVKK